MTSRYFNGGLKRSFTFEDDEDTRSFAEVDVTTPRESTVDVVESNNLGMKSDSSAVATKKPEEKDNDDKEKVNDDDDKEANQQQSQALDEESGEEVKTGLGPIPTTVPTPGTSKGIYSYIITIIFLYIYM